MISRGDGSLAAISHHKKKNNQCYIAIPEFWLVNRQ